MTRCSLLLLTFLGVQSTWLAGQPSPQVQEYLKVPRATSKAATGCPPNRHIGPSWSFNLISLRPMPSWGWSISSRENLHRPLSPSRRP